MDYNKKILQFFTNELDPLQSQELKVEMANDANVEEDMKLQQEVLFAIANQQDDNSDFRQQLEEIGNEFLEEEEKPKHSFTINYWLAAASVVVVIGLGSYLGLLKNDNYSGNQAFVEYYAPYGTDMTVRGTEQVSNFDQAFELYQSGDMSRAIESFNDLADENEELVGYFKGLCYIELGEIEKAKTQLAAAQEIAIFYEDQINWYLALCHVKQEEQQAAELLLTQILTSGNQYSSKAKELLEKLDL